MSCVTGGSNSEICSLTVLQAHRKGHGSHILFRKFHKFRLYPYLVSSVGSDIAHHHTGYK